MKRLAKIIAIGAAILYVAALILIYTQQRRFLYFPPSDYLTPHAVGLAEFEAVALDSGAQDITGWWSPPAHESKPVVMFFHGNGSAVYAKHEIYRELQAGGYGVFALAYPGYPGRSGVPTQESLTRAAIDAYDGLTARGLSPDKIVFYGTSLGGGVAAQLSIEREPSLLILESTFTSITQMGQLKFPAFPVGLLTKDKFDSVAALDRQNTPLLWLHGTSDRIISYSIGRTLYESYDGPKTGHTLEGGLHNDSWYRGGREIILAKLENL